MTIREILLIICSVGGIQSIFLGTDFLFFYEKRNISSKLLGALFFMLGIRVLKSTLYLFTEDLSDWFINLGFAAHYFVGPILLLHVLFLIYNAQWRHLYWLHFLPGLLLIILSPWLTLEEFWYRGGYSLLLFQSIAYLLWTFSILMINRTDLARPKFRWSLYLIVGIFIFLFIYFSNYELRLNPYYYAPIVYAAVVYILSFYLIKKRSGIFTTDNKYRNINLLDEQAENYKERIITHYTTQQPYLQNDYTLTLLSSDLKIPKHLLSLIFSSKINMSFVDFTNSYRIERAKDLLIKNPNFTVSSIAFDCGFNSVSSFNQSFKKFAKTTPSKFRTKYKDQSFGRAG